MVVIDRFYSKVVALENCWQWVAATDRNGYGQFWHNGQMRKAHRVNWELMVGEIPNGLELDHTCRNRRCVNPSHLEPVTHQINIQRAQSVREECPQGHSYHGDNLRINKRGHRVCRECHRKTNNSARNARSKEHAW